MMGAAVKLPDLRALSQELQLAAVAAVREAAVKTNRHMARRVDSVLREQNAFMRGENMHFVARPRISKDTISMVFGLKNKQAELLAPELDGTASRDREKRKVEQRNRAPKFLPAMGQKFGVEDQKRMANIFGNLIRRGAGAKAAEFFIVPARNKPNVFGLFTRQGGKPKPMLWSLPTTTYELRLDWQKEALDQLEQNLESEFTKAINGSK